MSVRPARRRRCVLPSQLPPRERPEFQERVAAILRAHPDPGPGTVNAAVGTVLHGLQVTSPAPPRSGAQCGWRARQDDDFCGHGVDTKSR